MHLLASALEMPVNRRPNRPMAAKLDARGASGSARWAGCSLCCFADLCSIRDRRTMGNRNAARLLSFFCQRRGWPGDRQFNRR